MAKLKNPADRFWRLLDKDASSGCWVWTGALGRGGYGQVTRDRRTRAAHRYAYELVHGPIPDGMQLDHLCRNRPCCNPAHLEVVTASENQRRSVPYREYRTKATACPKGHPYTDGSWFTYTAKDGTVTKKCRICNRINNRRYRQRHVTACPNGHEYVEGSYKLWPAGRRPEWRQCLLCPPKKWTRRSPVAA